MRYLLGIIATLIVLGSAALFFMWHNRAQAPYAVEKSVNLASFSRVQSSDFSVSIEDIRRMNQEAFRIVSRTDMSEEEAFAFYAMLAHLERRFVALSYAVSGDAKGSIVPIAHHVMCKVIPNECMFVWRTLDDHEAFEDLYTRILTDEVIRISQIETPRPIREMSTEAQLVINDTTLLNYAHIVQTRTDAQRRAAVLWNTGAGTRQAPGILLDLIDGYLVLDEQRTAGSFAVERSNLMIHAYEAYRSAHIFAAQHGYVAVNGDTQALPYMVSALHAVAPHLRPLLNEQGQKDFDTEIVDATNAFTWSGLYYPAAVDEAKRFGIVFTEASGDSIDVP